jgi:hypothetical protein
MRDETNSNKSMKKQFYFLAIVLFFVFSQLSVTVYAQEESVDESFLSSNSGNGFVTLFDGTVKYEGRGEEKNVLGSFFLVKIMDNYNIYLGAMTFGSFDSYSDEFNLTKNNGDKAEVTINTSFQHRAYGTIIGYVSNTNSFLGLQYWGGLGYLSNYIDVEGEISELVTESGSGKKYQCSGTSEGKSESISTFPAFLGVGFTLNDFGFFAQMISQTTENIEITTSDTITCYPGEVSTSTESFSNDRQIALSFVSTQIGIQYWF